MPTQSDKSRTSKDADDKDAGVRGENVRVPVATEEQDPPSGPHIAPESGDQKFRDELPRNDEPVIPMTYRGEEDANPVQVPPATVAPPEVVLPPRAPDPVLAHALKREVTEADLNSKGFNMLNLSAQQEFQDLVLRAGDRVNAGVEIIGIDDMDRVLELYPGAVVPEGQSGWVPTHYVLPRHLDRIRHEAAKRRLEAKG